MANSAQNLKAILVIVVSAILAVWLGVSLVTDQTETLIYGAAGAVVLTALFLGRKVWLLMIFFSAANVVLIRGFGTTDIGQALFLGCSLAMLCIRKLKFSLSFGELEVWGLLIVACILQAYFRNPVGLNVLGSGSVGARPYTVAALAIVSAALLSCLRVEPDELKWAMWLSLLGGVLGIFGNVLRTGMTFTEEGLARIPPLSTAGQIAALWLTSRISPLRACLHFFWGAVLLFSIFAAAGSAYRNAVAMVLLIYFFGICYRSGRQGMVFALIAASFGLGVLAIVNSNFPLPGNIQRALSPLPGTWEDQYVKGADASTDWRMEMWQEALLTDRWIHDKTFGDGMGMTAVQLQQNENISATRAGKTSSGLLVQQENMLINGSYHSGPVHTIRAVGYVGLVVLLLAMIRVSVHAHRQIMRCRNTEWFPVALYFGIPLLINPIFFVFIFGEFQTGVATTVLGAAMIRLFEKNLPLPALPGRRRDPYPLPVSMLRQQAAQGGSYRI